MIVHKGYISVPIDLKGDEHLFSILGIREELEILKNIFPNTIKNFFYSPKDKKMIVELDSSLSLYENCRLQIESDL